MAIKIPRKNLVSYLIVLFLLLALLLGIVSIVGNISEKNATPYSAKSRLNDVVYADIVSINPTTATTKYINRDKQSYEGFFCTCKTTDGVEFEVYIDGSDFSKYIKKAQSSWDTWRSTIPQEVIFDIPLRIIGRVEKRNSIIASPDESLIVKIRKADREAD